MIYHSSRRILFVSIPPPLFLENVNSERKLRYLKGSLHSNKSLVFQVHPQVHRHPNFRMSIIKNGLQIVLCPRYFSLMILQSCLNLHQMDQQLSLVVELVLMVHPFSPPPTPDMSISLLIPNSNSDRTASSMKSTVATAELTCIPPLKVFAYCVSQT